MIQQLSFQQNVNNNVDIIMDSVDITLFKVTFDLINSILNL